MGVIFVFILNSSVSRKLVHDKAVSINPPVKMMPEQLAQRRMPKFLGHQTLKIYRGSSSIFVFDFLIKSVRVHTPYGPYNTFLCLLR